MIRNVDLWLTSHWKRNIYSYLKGWKRYPGKRHILFTICDHYEPYWQKVNDQTAQARVKKWLDNYPQIASKHHDSYGNSPKHGFFYPEEEYRPDLLDMIGEMCQAGYGETEIHLHHDNDTAENLKKTLLGFKKVLSEKHGMLPIDPESGEIKYGFIHGNWALDNSRPDGRWCGVNNELDILQETGCYADFTMPSAPSDTQTKTINSIYYAVDDPKKPKSHDTGVMAKVGHENNSGLLCIQGPLSLNFHDAKFGIIPKIENGALTANQKSSPQRIRNWVDQQIHVEGRPDILFVKLYTHGTQEKVMNSFFDQNGMEALFSQFESMGKSSDSKIYYVSSRQMYNVVKGLEKDPEAEPFDLLNSGLVLQ